MGNAEVLEVLPENGANIEASDKHGHTPLYNACYKGHIAIIRILLGKAANIEASNEQQPATMVMSKLYCSHERAGVTPLIHAASMGRIHSVKALLEARDDAKAETHDGKTVLSVACETVQTRLDVLLLESGADNASANRDGLTPLHTASYVGNTGVVRLLIESSTDVQVPIFPRTSSGYAFGSGRLQALVVRREFERNINSAGVNELHKDTETELWSALDRVASLHLASAGGDVENLQSSASAGCLRQRSNLAHRLTWRQVSAMPIFLSYSKTKRWIELPR